MQLRSGIWSRVELRLVEKADSAAIAPMSQTCPTAMLIQGCRGGVVAATRWQ